jgi:hypothetical protein
MVMVRTTFPEKWRVVCRIHDMSYDRDLLMTVTNNNASYEGWCR